MVNISLATVVLSDKVLDALAVTALDAFYELRASTTVTFNLHQKSSDSNDCCQLRILSKWEHKRGRFSWVRFQANHSSNALKETTPRTGCRGGGGVRYPTEVQKTGPVGPCFAI